MTDNADKSCTELEEALAECRRADELVRRQIALLQAIIRVFRESMACGSEKEVARLCLRVAEELTGSAYSFIGELNPTGRRRRSSSSGITASVST